MYEKLNVLFLSQDVKLIHDELISILIMLQKCVLCQQYLLDESTLQRSSDHLQNTGERTMLSLLLWLQFLSVHLNVATSVFVLHWCVGAVLVEKVKPHKGFLSSAFNHQICHHPSPPASLNKDLLSFQ